MSNNADTFPVPARIVIVGTSKMRLSERFNQIQKEKPKAPQIVRKIDSACESLINGNASQVVERPRVFDNRMAREGSVGGKSFLHDDYMDNNLYGETNPRKQPVFGHLYSQKSYAAFDNLLDPVKLSLAEYDIYQNQKARSRRPFASQQNWRDFSMIDQEELYAHDLDVRPRSNFYNPVFRKPIHQRLSYKPSHRFSDFVLRRPIRNTVIFKRPYRGRQSGRRFNNQWFGGVRGDERGAPLRKNRWNDRRFKKSIHEMDRELDEYMKLGKGKHPRIQPVI